MIQQAGILWLAFGLSICLTLYRDDAKCSVSAGALQEGGRTVIWGRVRWNIGGVCDSQECLFDLY